jgi:hypothetical protein
MTESEKAALFSRMDRETFNGVLRLLEGERAAVRAKVLAEAATLCRAVAADSPSLHTEDGRHGARLCAARITSLATRTMP